MDGRLLDGQTASRTRAGAVVALIHAGLFAVIGLSQTPARILPELPAIQVELVRPVIPPPPPPPPPPEKPAPKVGGGAPAAPSVIHVPPKPRPVPVEVIGARQAGAETGTDCGDCPDRQPDARHGTGRDGQGDRHGRWRRGWAGSGTVPPRLITGPNPRQIAEMASPAARRARIDGTVGLRCDILLDTRLTNCRVLNEDPEGYDFRPGRDPDGRDLFPLLAADSEWSASCGDQPVDRHPVPAWRAPSALRTTGRLTNGRDERRFPGQRHSRHAFGRAER